MPASMLTTPLRPARPEAAARQSTVDKQRLEQPLPQAVTCDCNSPALSDASFGSIRSPAADGTVDVRTHAPELGEEIAGEERPFDPAVVSSYSCHGVEPGRGGTRDKINQDCAIVSHPYCADARCAFFGVFDGHGQRGEWVSTAVMDFVVSDLEARLLRDVQISAAISQAYEAANLHLAREHFEHANHSGACAATVLLHGHRMWTANAGDCRVVLGVRRGGKGGKLEALRLSVDHKPDEPSEMARVHARGAHVSPGKTDPFEPARLYRDKHRLRLGPGLAMSRCLGDLFDENAGVICTPTVGYYELGSDPNRDELFVVLASDGVWEHLDDLAVVEIIEAFHGQGKPAHLACTSLIARSAVAWRMAEGNYRDDITALVVYLPCLG